MLVPICSGCLPVSRPTSPENPTLPKSSVQVKEEEEDEEKGLFKADAVNKEDHERDRATQVSKVGGGGGGR